MDEGLDGLGLAVQEAHAQVVGGATARLEGILVGCEAVAGEDVAAVEEVLGDVSVQVHRGADHGLGADDAADGVDEVALGVVHALDAHSAVDVEEEAVEGAGGGEALEDLSLPGVVGAALDDAAGQGARVQDGDPLDLGGPVLVAPVEAVHQFLAAGDDEVVGGRDVGGERRGFDVDSGNRDAGLGHERFSFEIFEGVSVESPQSAASRPDRDDSITRCSMIEGRQDWWSAARTPAVKASTAESAPPTMTPWGARKDTRWATQWPRRVPAWRMAVATSGIPSRAAARSCALFS